ncbi:probable mannitol dehydrogenase [Selaginella moellendorffii]|nr:probable mannitol dehydrogenase [Selaginella moellendorffii]|eukprot:XP_002963866.2 probable mannitol dehydrogenase [Selaginella moellendorffii]
MGESAGFEAMAMAARDAAGVLAPFKLTRRNPSATDVVIKILYCGICHSDLHQIKNGWGITIFPVVPGHEITGVVEQLGSSVSRFTLGDHVAVGCLVSSCHDCHSCNEGLENYCPKLVWTYNSHLPGGSHTMGGFSTAIVVDESFVINVPAKLPLDTAAPLLCAGITVYSPMKHFGMAEAGRSFGVVGLGGLGHMAVKFGKAFGMKVTVISTSPKKEKEARELLGVDDFLVSTDKEQMAAAAMSIDYIIDTVSAKHALEPLLALLKVNGKMVLVGAADAPLQIAPITLLAGRRMIAGSLIGGIKETQEMMDFCGEHNVTAIVEQITMGSVNEAMERLAKSDVKYRFVIDMSKSESEMQRPAPL